MLNLSVLTAITSLKRPCLDWAVIVIETPSFAKADWQFIVVSLVLTLTMVVVAVVFTTLQVSIPLRRIDSAMQAIAQLDFDKSPRPSRVSEISGIVYTFDKLRAGTL